MLSFPRRADPYLAAFVVAGVVCRVAQYLSNRSFWADESFIVLNLRGKSAGELLGPLDVIPGAPQAGPPLWLLTEKAVMPFLGSSEFALRLPALLAGVAALGVFAFLARRLLSGAGAVVAVGVFALSDRLIWHSTEVKPYIFDTLAAIVLMWAAVPSETRNTDPGAGSSGMPSPPRSPVPRFLLTTVIALLALWFSYPAALVYAGVSLAFLAEFLRKPFSRPLPLRVYVAGNVAVGATFLAILICVIHDQQNRTLDLYWNNDFPPPTHPLTAPFWVLRRLLSTFAYAAEWCGPALFFIVPLGIFRLAFPPGTGPLPRPQSRQALLLLLAPFTITLFAAIARKYPLDGQRLNTFLIPIVLLIAAAGVDAIVSALQSIQPALARSALFNPMRFSDSACHTALAAALPMLILLPLVGLSAYRLVVPRTRGHLRPAVEYVLAHKAIGESVYAANPAIVRCYWPAEQVASPAAPPGHPWPRVLDPKEPPTTPFWLIVAAGESKWEQNPAPKLATARSMGTQRKLIQMPGAIAALFDPKAGPASSISPTTASTTLGVP